jgi:hypothetical protein
MPSNRYHFVTHWRIQATPQELFDILGDPTDLVRWWPSVYLGVTQLEPGDEDAVGRVIELYTKGWLPYTLRWTFRVTEVQRYSRLALEAYGDFVGRGVWMFEPDGDAVNITYDWQIEAQKPLLKLLSPVMKPIFAANHHWAMRMGEESLRLEVARRHAADPAQVPPPPGPTFAWLIRH